MSTAALETTLAKLYTDEAFRTRFLQDPAAALAPLELTALEQAALVNIDRDGLTLAAASYARKRALGARTRSRQHAWLAIARRVARWRAKPAKEPGA